MLSPTPDNLNGFLAELGRRCNYPAEIYIFGGSAMMLIGSTRNTIDVDFTVKADVARLAEFRRLITSLAQEMGLDVEESIPAEFMPLPPGADSRHQMIALFGEITAYIFDPYSIALSKLERGFKSDLEDVLFLVRNRHVTLDLLEQYLNAVAHGSDDPAQLRQSFEEIRRRA